MNNIYKYYEKALFSNRRKTPKYILKDIMDILYKNNMNKYKISLTNSLNLRGIENTRNTAKALLRDPKTDVTYIVSIERDQ